MDSQNPISLLRQVTGITQKNLAQKAETSQPTIALYESGAKSPTLSTLTRLAASVGLEISINFVPPLTREDKRSLAYHRVIVRYLKEKPDFVLEKAKRVLNIIKRKNPGARHLCNQWVEWLQLPISELISKMLEQSLMAREMRQVTPFAGLLTAQERSRILKKFRQENELKRTARGFKRTTQKSSSS